jgi:hypothetical protein
MVVGGADVWLAPVGESYPDVDASPSGNWAKLGSSGKKDYNEDGITVSHEQTLNQFRSLGSTGPRKVSRSEENLTVAGVLEDLTLEEYGKILNDVSVSTGTTSGSGADIKEITTRQGLEVSTFALLVRIPNAYGDGWQAQIQIPRVYQSENPSPAYTKDGKAGLSFTFTALEDDDAATDSERFGKIVHQTSAAP